MKKMILGGFLFAAAALAQSAEAAPYSGPWQQTGDGPVMAAELSLLTAGSGLFYLYDIDAAFTPADLLLFADGQLFSSTNPYHPVRIEVWDDNPGGGDWMARATALNLDNSETHLGTIGLGDSGVFGFYFANGPDVYHEYDLYGPLGGGSYTLSSLESGMTVNIENAAPVPLPATFLLFGSGLLGLAGVGRRRRTGTGS